MPINFLGNGLITYTLLAVLTTTAKKVMFYLAFVCLSEKFF